MRPLPASLSYCIGWELYAGDDFWFVVWNGKTFHFRYAGDATGKKLP
ncbi:MAG: hypothetical protein ABIP88_11510 [Candidatus Binatia bacterium]